MTYMSLTNTTAARTAEIISDEEMAELLNSQTAFTIHRKHYTVRHAARTWVHGGSFWFYTYCDRSGYTKEDALSLTGIWVHNTVIDFYSIGRVVCLRKS
jgi:hypothetical protein